MNIVDILEQPHNMSDSELDGEYQAVNSSRFDELIEDEEIDYLKKIKLLEYKDKVIHEKNYRDNGDWAIPLYSFGLFDF